MAPTDSATTVLRAVLRHGPLPRRSLARLVGLSGAAVTRHCARLLESGLLREVPAQTARRVGRPHVPIDIAAGAGHVLGVHLAHEFGTAVVSDLRGRILRQRRITYSDGDAEAVVAGVADTAIAWAGPTIPAAVAVTTGGWVDSAAGVLVRHSSLGWGPVAVRDIFARRTPAPVAVDNHTRGLVLAEELFGQVDPGESVLHLFVGNVVDAALRTGRDTHRGSRSAAGRIAHLPVGDERVRCPCGRRGCFEATVSDQAWAWRVAGRSFWELLADAERGDADARARFTERARIVGRAAALLCDLLNPDLLIVAELGTASMPECLDAIRAEVGAGRAVRASSFDTAAVLAMSAAGVAIDAVYRDPFGTLPSQNLDGD